MALSFTAEEIRVLGVLIEKQRATPDTYPMTVNALTNACNQKTNRDPVVTFSQGQVMRTLDALQKRRIVGTTSGMSSRVSKYWQALDGALGVKEPELVLLCALMLRGPQTVGELRGRTTRLYSFTGLDQVETLLNGLADRDDPLVRALPLQPGQKEARYVHLLSGEPDLALLTDEAYGNVEATAGDDRVDQLEEQVEALKARLDGLEAAFEDFRAQFE